MGEGQALDNQYRIGLFTSTETTLAAAIGNWAVYASNPLSTLEVQPDGGYSHPIVKCNLIGSAPRYDVWFHGSAQGLSLIHISEPTRLLSISYAVFCLKKKTPPTPPCTPPSSIAITRTPQ